MAAPYDSVPTDRFRSLCEQVVYNVERILETRVAWYIEFDPMTRLHVLRVEIKWHNERIGQSMTLDTHKFIKLGFDEIVEHFTKRIVADFRYHQDKMIMKKRVEPVPWSADRGIPATHAGSAASGMSMRHIEQMQEMLLFGMTNKTINPQSVFAQKAKVSSLTFQQELQAKVNAWLK